ncbi:MAG: hypothetical protein BAJALOKI3v1_770026 [Promethearchaeota archaeon]|nr:MAG: hypothetical protein BAJALOKI3v1_770026 [Candidatus Lokiarchaeota archaeon]
MKYYPVNLYNILTEDKDIVGFLISVRFYIAELFARMILGLWRV